MKQVKRMYQVTHVMDVNLKSTIEALLPTRRWEWLGKTLMRTVEMKIYVLSVHSKPKCHQHGGLWKQMSSKDAGRLL